MRSHQHDPRRIHSHDRSVHIEDRGCPFENKGLKLTFR